MAEIELFVFLLFAVAVLAGLGLRSGVPYPVALVLGGLVIGLVPGLPSPELDPDIVFFVFLPPLLYAAAITVSAHELKANWAPISLLAVGLVLVTIAAVAAVANAVLGIPWAAAFVLGAVLGPTDPVSAAAVLDRLGATGRSKTILQGESLINDGTGLTAYKIALAAVGASAGAWFEVSFEFAKVAAGGIAIGLAVGWIFAHLRRIVTDPSLDVTLSVVTPFIAYVPAEEVHVSGVLAVVAAGLYMGSRSLDVIEPGTRLRTLAFWESAAFLLDGLLFLLIGVQVPTIIERIEDANEFTLAGYALLISAVVFGTRFLWMLVVPAVLPSQTSRPERVVIAWSGMRGGVSLAAALAIPVEDFPQRDLVVFVAYAVIVITLVAARTHARAAAARARAGGERGGSPQGCRGADEDHPRRARAARRARGRGTRPRRPAHARPLRLPARAPRSAAGGRSRRARDLRRRPRRAAAGRDDRGRARGAQDDARRARGATRDAEGDRARAGPGRVPAAGAD